MQIDNLMYSEGSLDFYDPSFRDTLEAHITYLRAASNSYTINVSLIDTVVYNQDLFGYLIRYKVPAYLHWLVMRMNNLFSPYGFNESFTILLIPSSKDVEILRQSWKTTALVTR